MTRTQGKAREGKKRRVHFGPDPLSREPMFSIRYRGGFATRWMSADVLARDFNLYAVEKKATKR